MFLDEPPTTHAVDALYDAERRNEGYVMNLTHVWAWRPDVHDAYFGVRALVHDTTTLTEADRAALHAATAAARQDSYCGLAWGAKLAAATDTETAAQVMSGGAADDARIRALAAWARKVALDPTGTSAADVDALRAVGLDDQQIFEATFLVGWRLAFMAVNGALGAHPDLQLAAHARPQVRAAVSYGRPAAAVAST